MGHSQPRRLEERLFRELLLAAALLAIAAVQTTLLPRPLGFPPNLMLLLVVCYALIAGFGPGTRWAFYGGVALDFCTGGSLGIHALALLLAVCAAVVPLARMSRENWFLPIVGTLFGALGYYLALGVLTAVLAGRLPIRDFLLVAVLPDTLMLLIPALPLFMLWRAWNSRRRGEVPVDLF